MANLSTEPRCLFLKKVILNERNHRCLAHCTYHELIDETPSVFESSDFKAYRICNM